MRKLFLPLLAALGIASSQAAEQADRFQATITKQVGANYLVFTPKDYDPQKKYPMLLFLHGKGEQGNDLQRVKIHGPMKTIEALGLPMIVVAPQSPLDEWWDIDMLEKLVPHLVKTLPVDPQRLYLTGLSMGGGGSWRLAARMPNTFAAVVPICGWSIPSKAQRISHLPIRVYHGEKDRTIAMRQSKEMVEAIQKAGGEQVQLTIYPETGHNSWTETYSNPELYEWMLRQRLTADSQ